MKINLTDGVYEKKYNIEFHWVVNAVKGYMGLKVTVDGDSRKAFKVDVPNICVLGGVEGLVVYETIIQEAMPNLLGGALDFISKVLDED